MKMIYMTMAAVSALSVAAPVAAQSWRGGQSNTAQLQIQLDAGVRNGTISRREAMPLRDNLRQLVRLERQYSANGFSRWERDNLRQRGATLRGQIDFAGRSGNGRYDRDSRADRNMDGRDKAAWNERERSDFGKGGLAEYDRHDGRGDRFAGDLRVGQRISTRPVALPMEYRARYQDSNASYYRYDGDRIYQVDRITGLIMAMFDIKG